LAELKNGFTFTLNQLNTIQITLDNDKKSLEQAKQAQNPFICEQLFLETDGIEQNDIKIEMLRSELESNKQQLKFDSERQMIQKQSELESLHKQLVTEKARVNPYSEPLTQMKAMKLPETKEKELDELSKLMEHQDFLVKLLTKKDSFIRKSLLQKNLPLLNTRLKIYLEKMGLPHKVSFMENMSAQIKQFDTELEYNQLSSGQKARINLALCFAFRDVLQYRHGSVNFCMLDECLDVGLGNTGVLLAAKLIKEIADEQKLSLFVISHRDEASAMFARRLEIEYRNGFSTITVQ
jgi:ABC-type lipoprotein export system ATPase subunit